METSPTASHSAVSADLPPGAVVGEYRIERKLKHGGMGTVYEAVHQVIDKRVAVKVLKRELCENGEALHRFVQEARAVNQINHPNIVDVFGFGVTEDGRSFLAMELLVGETLGERMARGPVSREETCAILTEITRALEAAHACGVVHRDLKPENVFLAAGRVKLLDFGIAKLTGGAGLNGPVDVTQPGTLIGTPKYIAPEQARGLAVDGSADVYALGVIAFELLAGRPPFMATDPVELIAKHITLRPPAPSDFAPALPEVADVLVGEMLDKHPPNRPPLARIRALLDELAAAPDGRASRVELRRPETTVVSAMPAPDATVVDGTPAPRANRRWWIIGVVALAVVAVSVRVAVGVLDRGDDAPVPAAGESTLPAVVAPAPPEPQAAPAPAAAPPVVTPIPQVPADAAPEPEPEPEVEIDPQPAKKSLHKRPPARPKPPVVETKPAETPAPPPPKPPPDDRDGLRDPFHH